MSNQSEKVLAMVNRAGKELEERRLLLELTERKVYSLESELTSLKSSLIKAEAEGAEMRKALKACEEAVDCGLQEDVRRIVEKALSLEVGKDFLNRYQLMERVVSLCSGIKAWREMEEALAALDATTPEETL